MVWLQDAPADAAWIEYRFEGDDWLRTPATARGAGAHREVLLGVPAETAVTVRLANEIDGATYYDDAEHAGATGPLPEALLEAVVLQHDPTIASRHRYLLGTVDVGDSWYGGPCWVFILDRQGRYVWYREVPDHRLSLFAQVAHDGSHVLYEGTTNYVWDDEITATLDRTTLDLGWGEHLDLPGLGFSFDEIDGGAILYNDNGAGYLLIERQPDGSERTIWDCGEYVRSLGVQEYTCAPNSVVWNETQGTVFWSMYYSDTVVELDRATGEVVRRFGQIPGGWRFEPAETVVDYQHHPTYTPDGTILASTHMLSDPGGQYVHEWVPLDAVQTLRQIWTYGEGVDRYARYGGEAIRLENGNTFISYGTGGALREVTPDRQVAWELEWPTSPNTHLAGHHTWLDDLYALNRGPDGE